MVNRKNKQQYNETDDNNDDSCRDNEHNKEHMILSTAASIMCYQYRHTCLSQACSSLQKNQVL